MSDDDRTASLMTPARLAQLKVRPTPAASPAAWLDQLATDAGSGHIRRLLDLRGQLLALLQGLSAATAGQAATELAAALGEVDFTLLQPRGWIARATGKGKEAAATFQARCDRCAQAGERLAAELRALQRQQQERAGPLERTALECEVELKAIEKIMDQGARWLQDMRNQLKAREAAGGDAATLQKIQEDSRRCELLVARLKQLRAASGATQPAIEHCKALPQRGAALAASLQQALEGGWKDASRRLDRLCEQAGGGTAAEGAEALRQSLPALADALQQAAGDAQALQSRVQAAATELTALQEPLQAAA
ncbi:MAG TPA: hypothetical protein VFM98_01460 [Ramlibacter sp.]|uniref:hypothetical protein n=1 Tax=Ramlibacter sp. TaxID=1917967 RepID=UPI002D7F9532|nr:hypothetical protein [Ramlibacter sp.]HET8744243.1 hypothetical protein [Ramlibacter sp.]